MISVHRHVGILYIKSDLTFKIDPIPLHTVRPFIIEGVHLKDTGIHHQDDAAVEKYLSEKVADMIDRVTAENEGNDKLPLVRLKVQCCVCVCRGGRRGRGEVLGRKVADVIDWVASENEGNDKLPLVL